MTPFHDFGLAEPILRALAEENYTTPTPIQAQAIPLLVEGRDIIGIAQTGTGKTAAFALPILNRLAAKPMRPERKTCRVLVLSPTRELSGQILESFRTYGRHLRIDSTLAIGGVPMGKQVRALANGVDVLVATPGRLLDLVQSHAVRLDRIEAFVLDEADRMLDMGFIHDIRKIIAKLPKERQTLLFSATMPQSIAELAGEMLRNPARVAVAPVATTAERIAQRVIHLDQAAKGKTLSDLLRAETVDRALIFTRTKHGADKVVRGLIRDGIAADAIHGNKSQNQRERVLADFRSGRTRTLVATDIAARGIDVDGVSHVVNYDLPNIPESYVHRIGRTARAGAEGIAISLCAADEVAFLRDIERLIRMSIPATGEVPQGRTPQRQQPSRGGGQSRGGENRNGQGQNRGGQGQNRNAGARNGGGGGGGGGGRGPRSDRPQQGRPSESGRGARSERGPARDEGRRDRPVASTASINASAGSNASGEIAGVGFMQAR